MEQPKDYDEKIPTFEEFLDQEYHNLGILDKIEYHLQDHIWKAIFVGVVGGYFAGTYFGIFW